MTIIKRADLKIENLSKGFDLSGANTVVLVKYRAHVCS